MESNITIKQRDNYWDTFRGFLMWLIPISHFTMVGGDYHRDSLSGIIYITINVFVMQAFVFLSGYFSTSPDKARKTAFKTFLYPYLVLVPVFYFVRVLVNGYAKFDFFETPFALWYLLALFFYRFFLIDYIKAKYILFFSIFLYLIAGQFQWMDGTLSLGRVVSYFPFFLLGYYCKKEHVDKILAIKKRWIIPLGIFLINISVLLAYCINVKSGFYLLRESYHGLNLTFYQDLLMRIVDFILPCLWIVFFINIMPKGKNYLTYVGKNTMPVYILHLIVRYVVKQYGFPDENAFIYYLCIFGLASLCVIVFSSPPVSKAWNWIFDNTYRWLGIFCKKMLCIK